MDVVQHCTSHLGPCTCWALRSDHHGARALAFTCGSIYELSCEGILPEQDTIPADAEKLQHGKFMMKHKKFKSKYVDEDEEDELDAILNEHDKTYVEPPPDEPDDTNPFAGLGSALGMMDDDAEPKGEL